MESNNEIIIENEINTSENETNIVNNEFGIKIKNIEDNATLAFFTNPMYLSTLKRKNIMNEENNSEKIKFYKKRIISLFKDILRGNETPPTNEIKELHHMFSWACVKYFEQLDKKDIIQSQHVENEDNNKSSEDMLNEIDNENDMKINTIDEANEIMMRKTIAVSNLENYVISNKDNSGNDVRIIPHIINIDLKTPDLKTKGVKEKRTKTQSKITKKTNNQL